jgi:magnesium chelatase subunit D
LISHLCCEFEVASLRADIVMHKTARALAALEGREKVDLRDIRGAAELVLPHRRRRKPFEQPGLDQQRLDDLMPPASNEPQPPEQTSGEHGDDASEDRQPGLGGDEQVFAASAGGAAPRIAVEAPTDTAYIQGRRSAANNTARGQMLRAVPNEQPTSIAIGATLRSAALRDPANMRVVRADLHQQVKAGTSGNLIVFVVDASGSMAAQRRMEALKGAVLNLLTDAYQQRDEVAVVAFRGQGAQVLLAPTRSVDLAERSLRELPTGGRTPLPHALQLALEVVESAQSAQSGPPLLVLMTDGKANVPLADAGDPWRESLELAELLSERRIPSLVIDTESGYTRFGRAARLAQALRAECLTLEELSADNLALTVRARLAGA